MSRPLYPRLLGLRHVHPNGWQRALLGEGALVLAGLLVLADVASAWALLAVPLAVAAVVKAHDVLAGLLGRGTRAGAPEPEVPGVQADLQQDGRAPRGGEAGPRTALPERPRHPEPEQVVRRSRARDDDGAAPRRGTAPTRRR